MTIEEEEQKLVETIRCSSPEHALQVLRLYGGRRYTAGYGESLREIRIKLESRSHAFKASSSSGRKDGDNV